MFGVVSELGAHNRQILCEICKAERKSSELRSKQPKIMHRKLLRESEMGKSQLFRELGAPHVIVHLSKLITLFRFATRGFVSYLLTIISKSTATQELHTRA